MEPGEELVLYTCPRCQMVLGNLFGPGETQSPAVTEVFMCKRCGAGLFYAPGAGVLRGMTPREWQHLKARQPGLYQELTTASRQALEAFEAREPELAEQLPWHHTMGDQTNDTLFN